MGLGDEIMASGRARVLHEKTGKRVCIVNKHGSPRWHEIWDGIDFLSKDLGEDVVTLVDGPGSRPYINGVSNGAVLFNMKHRPIPGVIAITPEVQSRADSFIIRSRPVAMIEPGFKGTNSADNKDWGWKNWVRLSARLIRRGISVIQVPVSGRKILPNVPAFCEQSLHGLAALVKSCDLVITTEGGLHHMAAAMRAAAVVIWGGYTSPEFLGYLGQANIYDEHKESPCGLSYSCPHCRERMDAISVDRVEALAVGEIGEEECLRNSRS